MTGMKFYNFKSNMKVLETCSGCSPVSFYNTPKEFSVSETYFFNVSGKYLSFGGMRRDIIHDLDGTFTS